MMRVKRALAELTTAVIATVRGGTGCGTACSQRPRVSPRVSPSLCGVVVVGDARAIAAVACVTHRRRRRYPLVLPDARTSHQLAAASAPVFPRGRPAASFAALVRTRRRA